MTKRSLMSFMGKGDSKDAQYEFGDFTKTVKRRVDAQKQNGGKEEEKLPSAFTEPIIDAEIIDAEIMDAEVLKDLEEFDKLWEERITKNQ
jgi:hypothetical protein